MGRTRRPKGEIDLLKLLGIDIKNFTLAGDIHLKKSGTTIRAGVQLKDLNLDQGRFRVQLFDRIGNTPIGEGEFRWNKKKPRSKILPPEKGV